MPGRRVVITGLGMVTPLGVGRQRCWQAMLSGKSGGGSIDRFDATDYPTRIACQVRDFKEGRELLGPRLCRNADLFVQYAMVAADEAWNDAGIGTLEEREVRRSGVYIGAGFGGMATIENSHATLLERGPRKLSPYFIPAVLPNLAAGQVAIRHGLQGPSLATVTACASGAHAIGEGFRSIAHEQADVMLCGGTEAVITPLVVAGFSAMHAMSRRNDDPAGASRPFDLSRDGFVIGEGAAVLVLEAEERARRRGARIYGEILGYGNTNDAHHITAPLPEGMGAAACMSSALQDGRIDLDRVDHVNAHGTSTPAGDRAETEAIKQVLGSRAREVTVTANKSMLGHTMGASGAIEAAVTVLSIAEGCVPPTINLETPDPQCDLDYVPNEARETRIDVALCNSFGFGGTNACLALTG